jgi:hypothetical protein
MVGAAIGMMMFISLVCIVSALCCVVSWRPICTCCGNAADSFEHPSNQLMPPSQLTNVNIQVACPLAASPGSQIELTTKDGQEIVVTVPVGVMPGQRFQHEYTPNPAPEKATLHVAVPVGAMVGQLMQVQAPDGTTLRLPVPQVIAANRVVVVEYTPKAPVPATKDPWCNWCCFEPRGESNGEDGQPARAKRFGRYSCTETDPPSARMLHKGRRVPTEALTCIRGFGALQVAVGHYYTFMDTDVGHESEFGGGNAVLMFFVMSGFVMMIGYAGKAPVDGCCGYFSRDFWLRRVARIGPVVWLSLLLCIPISILAPSEEVGVSNDGAHSPGKTIFAYFATATFMQTWVGTSINGPLWSICAQFFCYHWFPVIVGPFHTVRNRGRWVQ